MTKAELKKVVSGQILRRRTAAEISQPLLAYRLGVSLAVEYPGGSQRQYFESIKAARHAVLNETKEVNNETR